MRYTLEEQQTQIGHIVFNTAPHYDCRVRWTASLNRGLISYYTQLYSENSDTQGNNRFQYENLRD